MKCPRCSHENPAGTKFCGNCTTPLLPTSTPSETTGPDNRTETRAAVVTELRSGTTFAGRFEVIEELGKGGMGRVYKVYDQKTREKIALKLLKPEVATDRQAIERFGNELRFARKISHRNVCRMFDLDEEEGTHFITMEYVPGEDLKSIIRMMGPMSAGKTLHVARQVSEGLAEAHRLGVVHRDLKPQNIMIDREGNIRIMDFGIARSAKVKGLTGAGVVVGTPEYMSPEQFEGKEADARSDIYALGVILYEMTTGRLPFEGDTFVAIALKQKTEAPKAPKELNAQLPDDLGRLILKCLAKDPGARYQSVEDILADLGRIEKGVPTTEKIVPSIPTTSKQITISLPPRKFVIPIAAVLAVAAALVIIFGVLPGRKTALRASSRPTVAVVNFENKTGDEALDIWTTGIRDLLIMDLNQSKFMNVLSDTDIYGILKKFGLADTATFSTGDLVKIADAGGAQYTVNGSFLKAGDEIIINAACQKPHSRDVVSPIQVTCRDFGEIRDRIDEMTRKIKADLNLTPAQIGGDIDRNIGEISTPNAEAWAYYVESRRCHFRGEPEKAIPLLQKTLSLDPEFIIAYRALGVAYHNINDFINQKKYYSRAIELIQSHPERVSERDRLFIEQDFYLWNRPEPEWGKSLDAGRKLLALYPQDTRGAYNLGVYSYRMEDWDEASKYFETCISEGDWSLLVYSWISDVFLEKDEPSKAREILEKYLREVENNATGRQELAYLHLGLNRLDLAAKELEAAETLAPDDYGNRVLRADWLVQKGDLPEAEAAYRALIGEKIPAASYSGYIGLTNLLTLEGRDGELIKIMVPLAERFKSLGLALPEWACHRVLARAYWRSGRTEAALDECRKADAIDTGNTDFSDKRSVIHLRGLIHLSSNRIDEAEKTAGELKAYIEKGLNKKAIRRYDHLMGSVEMARNNMPKALEHLEKAVRSDERNTQFIDTLAEAYVRTGDLSRARGQYEKITRLTIRDDNYALSFYHLGRIDEKLGDKTRAGGNYRKFLDLWKNADPGRPEVEDARKRLAALAIG